MACWRWEQFSYICFQTHWEFNGHPRSKRIFTKVLENGLGLLYSGYGGKYSLGLVHAFEGLIPVPKPGKPLSPIEDV